MRAFVGGERLRDSTGSFLAAVCSAEYVNLCLKCSELQYSLACHVSYSHATMFRFKILFHCMVTLRLQLFPNVNTRNGSE